MSLFYRMCLTRAPGSVLLIRLMVGGVFLSEGFQTFLQDAGSFTLTGLSWPEVLAPFTGGLEIVCGLLVVLGFFTRLAVIPLLLIILLDLIGNKLAFLWYEGFWKMLHEAKTDYCMLLGLLFLLLAGSGTTSMDAWLTGKRERRNLKMASARR